MIEKGEFLDEIGFSCDKFKEWVGLVVKKGVGGWW
jgi:hypothetical protein